MSETSSGFDGQPNVPTFSGIRNEPGIQVKPEDETHEDRVRQQHREQIQMLRAQRGSAAEHGVAMIALQDLLEQVTGLAEDARIEQAEKAEAAERVPLAERRRWHALACLTQGGALPAQQALESFVLWLEHGTQSTTHE